MCMCDCLYFIVLVRELCNIHCVCVKILLVSIIIIITNLNFMVNLICWALWT